MTEPDDRKDADMTQALPLCGDTADIPIILDETVQMDPVAGDDPEKDSPADTRSFPATIADDGQAKDMTVMLDKGFSDLVGVSEEAPAVPFKTGKHSKLPAGLVDDAALVPSGKTDILPLTPKYFEQFETDELPADALDPKTQESALYAEPLEDSSGGRKRKGPIIITLLAIALLVAAGAVVWIIHNRSVHDDAIVPHAINLQINAAGYDANDSKIPLHIEGIDMDGNYVDSIAYVGPDGKGLELVRGSYTISMAASPLLDTAELYKVADVQLRIDIPDSIEARVDYTPDSAEIKLETAAMTDITNGDINRSYDYAIKSGFDTAKADAYRAALTIKRDSELANKQALEEKAQRRALAQTALEEQAKSRGVAGITSKIVDLDGDDIPEMVLAGNSDSSVGAMCFVYGYDVLSHRVVELCSAPGGSNHTPGIWYSTGSHEVVLATTSSSGETYTIYEISSGLATSKHVYAHVVAKASQASGTTSSTSASTTSSSSSSSKSDGTYTFDGQSITAQVYSEFISGLDSGYASIWSPAL